ncbi:erythromycin esterase family protein [Streptoalloteichus hindustanus]|uniref:Erythromycin esterase homolog n=1 Tax=Streptoalloteichus hindustanus TaxID=2017 RepID=A0A1M5LAY4_STRHI|nr:erythromycin esterase family protein [Streptoalloteichus hindustanus]SHG62177.1 Erythromycin esterase homolog [Streptoalloteichus hindustanus]
MGAIDQIRAAALPLRGAGDLDPVVERIGRARFVLLGEATHGTSEFYRWRAELTRRLVAERDFSFVAVEGDWPDCHAVHRSVVGVPGAPDDPREPLLAFARWPTWMWANEEVVEFVRWLRQHNETRPPEHRVGFHGLDVYSLWDSLHAVLDYLRDNAPEHLDAAMAAYRCFEPYGEDPQAYARAAGFTPARCERQVVELLLDLRAHRAGDDTGEWGARFVAEQNARIVAGAERYYRAMMRGGAESWNVRDHHMVDTLDHLAQYYGDTAKGVVWEHNTHVGDARATDMAPAGMVNVGQLVRESHSTEDVVIVGFGTYSGTVIASERWGGPVRRMRVPEARRGSLEAHLHQANPDSDALFVFPDNPWATDWLCDLFDHRAIGVVYDPERELVRNYVPTVLGKRYDAFVHCDRSNALHPLHGMEPAEGEKETYPTGV